MSFLDRADTKFVSRFCDPDQRQSLLNRLSFRKRLLIYGMWSAVGLGALIAVVGLAPALREDEMLIAIQLGMATFVLFMIGLGLLLDFQAVSERLLLLRVIDQLEQERNASNQPPNANS